MSDRTKKSIQPNRIVGKITDIETGTGIQDIYEYYSQSLGVERSLEPDANSFQDLKDYTRLMGNL